MKLSLKIIVFASSLLVAGSAWASPLEQLQAFAVDMQTFSADFEQQVVDESGRLLETSGGTMAMQKPARFRWHYTGEFEQLIVADGQRVWVHDIELEQVTVRDQDLAAANSPFYVLTDPKRLEQDYQLEDRGQINGLTLIGLLPKAIDGEIEWVEVGFRDQLLELVVIQDALGQQTRIRFSRPQLNLPLAESAFKFSPPVGVDVIGAEELTLDLDP
jgi:outer membrane lipoprotein carrier protein